MQHIRLTQETSGEPQETPKDPRRSQETPGDPRRSQETPGDPRRSSGDLQVSCIFSFASDFICVSSAPPRASGLVRKGTAPSAARQQRPTNVPAAPQQRPGSPSDSLASPYPPPISQNLGDYPEGILRVFSGGEWLSRGFVDLRTAGESPRDPRRPQENPRRAPGILYFGMFERFHLRLFRAAARFS